MKKFKNHQRPRRKYRFDIIGHKKSLKNLVRQSLKEWLIIALFSMHTVTESFVILTNFLANPGNVSTYKKRVVSLAVFESFRQIQS